MTPPPTGIDAYAPVFTDAGLPAAAGAVAAGRVAPPTIDLVPALPGRTYPPALLPLWVRPSDGLLTGFWWHPLSGDAPTGVTVAPAAGFVVREYARDAEQLFARACLTALSVWGGPIPSVAAFAAATGLDLAALDAVSLAIGDDPAALASVGPFRGRAPLSIAEAAGVRYTGPFPAPEAAGDDARLRRTAGLEVGEELAARLRGRTGTPAWLRGGDPVPVFAALLDAGDPASAWLALNSPGWPVGAARDALARLSATAGDARVEHLATAWAAQPHDGYPGY
ncbi:hypothetical protein [Micromonospora sp. NPDC005806]|uniref:hypothetical protein n=1 Tax=Micromonospora sp. NPDC005806 TaxID=3364234 RepID=UPI0036A68AC1